MFFFFQAEDGIRDYKVTGVQTCALPISLNAVREFRVITQNYKAEYQKASSAVIAATTQSGRSEERRVGKSVDLGGRRIIKKKKKKRESRKSHYRRKKQKTDKRQY